MNRIFNTKQSAPFNRYHFHLRQTEHLQEDIWHKIKLECNKNTWSVLVWAERCFGNISGTFVKTECVLRHMGVGGRSCGVNSCWGSKAAGSIECLARLRGALTWVLSSFVPVHEAGDEDDEREQGHGTHQSDEPALVGDAAVDAGQTWGTQAFVHKLWIDLPLHPEDTWMTAYIDKARTDDWRRNGNVINIKQPTCLSN